MSVYPFDIDDDNTIIRIDDNLSELGTEAINQLRDAVFAIEKELGINPAGSAGSVAARLDTSLNPDGTIKASALTSVGLATLPIVDNQVASNAGIKEFKLSLDYGTSDLNTLIADNSALLNSLAAFASTTDANLISHIKGVAVLADGVTLARHVASQIDLNAVPSDTRDPAFVWGGLVDKDGNPLSATTVGRALQQINDSFNAHQNAVLDAHVASAIQVDTSSFEEIPQTADNVQKALDAIDDAEVLNLGQHRATQHANAIPRITRAQGFNLPDGYKQNVVPPTPVSTYLVTDPNTSPVDNTSIGDDIVKFLPENPKSTYVFDSQFSQVRSGDIIRINYGNGIEALYPIDSVRYNAGLEWFVRLNGVNLFNSGDGYSDGYNDGYAYARIDRPLYDRDTAGILAVAPANAIPSSSFSNILSSLIVSDPKGATALGLGFDPGQLDSTHYNLYLELYPTGNPAEKVISLPAIDVTGNAGVTPGKYNLEDVVQQTNNSLRNLGYNYRFIAFAYKGDFGIMLADSYGGASFAIISGDNSSGTLVTGSYVKNVIGGDTLDNFDALGFGAAHADAASPSYQASFPDVTAAQLPTKVIPPLKQRYYIVNGRKRDDFAPTYNANADGSWDGEIFIRNVVGAFTVEVTYKVPLNLEAAGLKKGKTIVIQPSVSFTDPAYKDVDYGRFIIKEVSFEKCAGQPDCTYITVINGIHATGNAVSSSSTPSLPVKLFFSEDSVSFDKQNVIDDAPSSDNYSRLHEVYVNKEGVTFTHERARIPMQLGTTELLETSRWHIRDVSPKFRGYRDGNPLEYARFIRLYVTNYNIASGEFDGYIGQRPGLGIPGILNVGPITRGRKNVSVRFYDETNVDYIDLEFNDFDVYPGVTVTPDRYVDIEIFPTLKLNDENLLLATCEVNWRAELGKEIVEHVLDRRQFGSVDETDFTDSAIEFISAGDRYLHGNGVIRGLDFDYINPSDDREIFFKGGLALVNGAISVLNNSSVTIPEIYDASGLPVPPNVQVVNWAVCATEDNNLVPIIVTSVKQQFFASTPGGASSYYVPSVTFAELINDRKDLTPIAIMPAIISSFTAGTVSDLRKFVFSETTNPPLTLSSGGFHGNFKSFEPLINWINNLENSKNLVTLKGTFDIDQLVDLTQLERGVVFEGDGAVLNVSSDQGFLVDKDITFRNLTFNYDPIGLSYSANDKINSANGCIFGGTDSVERITIENCSFYSDLRAGEQRPPYICMERGVDGILNELRVIDCNFNDNDVSPARDQSAIAIIRSELTGPAPTTPSLVANCQISGNTCNLKQGIYITQENSTGTIDDDLNSLSVINTTIENNFCGVIGFLVGGVIANTFSYELVTNRTKGLVIQNNSCNLIGNIANYIDPILTTGTFLVEADDIDVVAGSFAIHNNSCNWINVSSTGSDPFGVYASQKSITDNRLTAFDVTYLSNYTTSPIVGGYTCISVFHNNNSSVGEVVISRNIIDRGAFDEGAGIVFYGYLAGIFSSVSGTITENIIRGIDVNGYGILLSTVYTGEREFIVQSNKIDRQGLDISRYIEISTDNTQAFGLVRDNFFDSPTIDQAGTDTEVVNDNHSLNVIVTANKNQTEVVPVHGAYGQLGTANSNAATFNSAGYTANLPPATGFVLLSNASWNDAAGNTVQLYYGDLNQAVAWNWTIPLSSMLPYGVEIISAQVTVTVSGNISGVGIEQALFVLQDNIGGAGHQAPDVQPLVSGGTTNHTLSGPNLELIRNIPSTEPVLKLQCLIETNPNSLFINVSECIITYRW
jgi:hypothetical protein